MVSKSIVVTGHRCLGPEDTIRIRMSMKVLVEKPHVSKIYFGGAKGADYEALLAALEFRTRQSPELIVVVPNRLEHQPRGCQIVAKRADRIVELRQTITEEDNFEAYRVRNKYMVDQARQDSLASMVLAYWNGDKNSGTYHCLNYARSHDMHIQVLKIRGLV